MHLGGFKEMPKVVDDKYSKGNFVQFAPEFKENTVLLNTQEIQLLVEEGKIKINKYPNHELRENFPHHNLPIIQNRAKEIFMYNEPYLKISQTEIQELYFVYSIDSSYCYEEILEEQPEAKETQFVNSQYLQEILNPDSNKASTTFALYIFSSNGQLLYAKNKKDGMIVNEVEQSLEEQENKYIIVTSNKGKFTIKRITITPIKEDLYQVEIVPIPIKTYDFYEAWASYCMEPLETVPEEYYQPEETEHQPNSFEQATSKFQQGNILQKVKRQFNRVFH